MVDGGESSRASGSSTSHPMSSSTPNQPAHYTRVPPVQPLWLKRGVRPTIKVAEWEDEQLEGVPVASQGQRLNQRTHKRSYKLPMINNRLYAEAGPIVIYVNIEGAPCESPTYPTAPGQLSKYIGSIARLFPFEPSWEQVHPDYLRDLFLDIATYRYDFRRAPPFDAPPCLWTELDFVDVHKDEGLRKNLTNIASKAWGDEKQIFVRKVRKDSMSLEWARDMLSSDGVPFPYTDEHFKELHEYWLGAKYESLSTRCKHARAKLITLHSSGSRAMPVHFRKVKKPMGDGNGYVWYLAGSTDENVLPAHEHTALLVKRFREDLSNPSVSQMSELERDREATRVMHKHFVNPHHHHPIGYGKTKVRKRDVKAAAAWETNPIIQAHIQDELRCKLADKEEEMARQREADKADMMVFLESQMMEKFALAQQRAEDEAMRAREADATRIREETAKMVEEKVAAARSELEAQYREKARLAETPPNEHGCHESTSSAGTSHSRRATSHQRKKN